jgi:hypothetical protein
MTSSNLQNLIPTLVPALIFYNQRKAIRPGILTTDPDPPGAVILSTMHALFAIGPLFDCVDAHFSEFD